MVDAGDLRKMTYLIDWMLEGAARQCRAAQFSLVEHPNDLVGAHRLFKKLFVSPVSDDDANRQNPIGCDAFRSNGTNNLKENMTKQTGKASMICEPCINESIKLRRCAAAKPVPRQYANFINQIDLYEMFVAIGQHIQRYQFRLHGKSPFKVFIGC
jgi:hypothetical protein